MTSSLDFHHSFLFPLFSYWPWILERSVRSSSFFPFQVHLDQILPVCFWQKAVQHAGNLLGIWEISVLLITLPQVAIGQVTWSRYAKWGQWRFLHSSGHADSKDVQGQLPSQTQLRLLYPTLCSWTAASHQWEQIIHTAEAKIQHNQCLWKVKIFSKP